MVEIVHLLCNEFLRLFSLFLERTVALTGVRNYVISDSGDFGYVRVLGVAIINEDLQI